MGRIREAYETKFRALLGQVGARRTDQALAWLADKAERLSGPLLISPERSFEHVYQRLSDQVEAYSSRHGSSETQRSAPPRFLCDAGLGGLARWLRAAGYESHWTPNISDDAAIREAIRLEAILLTTDSILMQRRLLRDLIIPSVWVSPALKVTEQLAHVLRELKLPLLEPRCMSCGGELAEVPKEQVQDRIPPRTLRWLDNYFECQECGKLFWHGTHWERIQQQLHERNA